MSPRTTPEAMTSGAKETQELREQIAQAYAAALKVRAANGLYSEQITALQEALTALLSEAKPEQGEAVTREEIPAVTVEQAATDACQWLCELPDRTSPEDWPEACLVEPDELHAYLVEYLTEFTILRKSPATSTAPMKERK